MRSPVTLDQFYRARLIDLACYLNRSLIEIRHKNRSTRVQGRIKLSLPAIDRQFQVNRYWFWPTGQDDPAL